MTTNQAADRELERIAERRAALVVLGLNPNEVHTLTERAHAWHLQWDSGNIYDLTRPILRELAPSLGINVESME